jgi:hypothetical protein
VGSFRFLGMVLEVKRFQHGGPVSPFDPGLKLPERHYQAASARDLGSDEKRFRTSGNHDGPKKDQEQANKNP